MHPDIKSELIKHIELLPTSLTCTELPNISGVLPKVLVNMGKPKKNLTFKCYYSEIFTSQVKEHDLDYSSGITDVVFDTYKEKCLKGASKKKKKCNSESTITIFYDWGKRKLNFSTTSQQKKYQKGRIKVS